MNTPWVSETRRESGLVELVCKCGVGHPAPGSVHWLRLHGKESMGVHGCCGCCRTPEWRLAAAVRGYEKANEILKNTLANYRNACGLIMELHELLFKAETKGKTDADSTEQKD